MTFEELLKMFPTCGPVKFTISAERPDVSFVVESRPGFVAPTLSARDDILVVHEPDNILIISASGAVGKTTLSEELAYRKQAPRATGCQLPSPSTSTTCAENGWEWPFETADLTLRVRHAKGKRGGGRGNR
jgi:hypothetical protein